MIDKTILLSLCECGCGGYAKPGNRFINGHNRRDKKIPHEQITNMKKTIEENKGKPKPEPKLCECGCGELAKPGNRFIYGHSHRGDHHSQKTKDKMSEAKIGMYDGKDNPMYGVSRTGKDAPMYGKKHSPETCKKIGDTNRNPPDSTRKKMSVARINSDAAKASAEKQRGGSDIVRHHHIYDHSDLPKNTIQMTRSDHMRLHRLLRKLKYNVPHINIRGK